VSEYTVLFDEHDKNWSWFREHYEELVKKFGAEFLIIAEKKGLRIGKNKYAPPPRRKNPRIGGKIKANLRITWALIKSLTLYLI
jgi:dolichol-phosphate mannosyltransferase